LLGGTGRAYPPRAHSVTLRPVDVFDDLADELQRAFPDAGEREAVTARIRAERTGHLPPADITPTQRQRWTEAHRRADARVRARDMATSGTPRDLPEDLRTRPMPAGWRQVPPQEVPARLYFYDSLPYGSSRLHLYSRDFDRSASIATELLSDGVYGVRATSLTANAPLEAIDRAMGHRARRIRRQNAFTVGFDTERLIRPGHTQARAPVDVYTRIDGPADLYFLVPKRNTGSLRLDTFQESRLSDLL
jgi:hypothetical protein